MTAGAQCKKQGNAIECQMAGAGSCRMDSSHLPFTLAIVIPELRANETKVEPEAASYRVGVCGLWIADETRPTDKVQSTSVLEYV